MNFEEERLLNVMGYTEAQEFFDNLGKLSDEEVIEKLPAIHEYFHFHRVWYEMKEQINQIFARINKLKAIQGLFRNEPKFEKWTELLDFPQSLKYGVEVEVAEMNLDEIKTIFDDGIAQDIFDTLGVPNSVSQSIIQRTVFDEKDKPQQWIFSKEGLGNEAEASSPIMQNTLSDLNQISAVCLLFKALGAQLHGGTGLHINVRSGLF